MTLHEIMETIIVITMTAVIAVVTGLLCRALLCEPRKKREKCNSGGRL